MATKIEWCDEVWNPITGCSSVSPACDHCYARRMANRLKGRFGYPKDYPFKVTYHRDRLSQPMKWKKPKRIFVCSMGDMFHEYVAADWIDSIVGIMNLCKHHTFIVLTKRPKNIKEKLLTYYHNGKKRLFSSNYAIPKNMWIGVTAENQIMFDYRAFWLKQIPASVRFVSVEPMLERIDMDGFLTKPIWGEPDSAGFSPLEIVPRNDLINWVICGAETGPGRRVMRSEWAYDLMRQCEKAGIPFFFKKDSPESPVASEVKNKNEFPRWQPK